MAPFFQSVAKLTAQVSETVFFGAKRVCSESSTFHISVSPEYLATKSAHAFLDTESDQDCARVYQGLLQGGGGVG